MKILLNENKKAYLEARHKKERDGRVRDRIKAVLLSNEGWTQKQIAQALRIHETTVQNYLDDYAQKEKLKPSGGGSSSKLNKDQTQELIAHLERKTYPSTKEIIQHIENTYNINYTQQGMYDWLKIHKFSYKKPKGTPAKFNKERQEAFIQKYEVLKSKLDPNELILFMDSVHPTQKTKITYGWIRTGTEKLIATIAGQGRINLTGAVDLKTMSMTIREYETIRGTSIVEFLKEIEKAYPNFNKIHIIADGSGAHTSKEVKLFLSEASTTNRFYLNKNYGINLPSNNKKLTKKIKLKLEEIIPKEKALFKNNGILEVDGLTACQLLDSLKEPPKHPKLIMHILPPYSPNLNPIERVWKIMNEQVRNNQVFPTIAELKNKINKFFSLEWSTLPDLGGRINDHFQILKPVI